MKSNYTTAVTHFPITITKYIQLEEKLKLYSSFKISNNINNDPENIHYVCFGFDKTLETLELVNNLVMIFGITNPSSHSLFQKYLPKEIYQENLNKLITCYPNGLKYIKKIYKQNILKIEPKITQELVNNLVMIFGITNPSSHSLFQKYLPKEIYQENLNKLITCYPNGLKYIKKIYKQNILKIEPKITQGRRTTEVIRMKLKDYSNQKKSRVEKMKKTQNINSTIFMTTIQN
ncbi:hypothetical protein Glove_309g83 [Diversispora epigaea]|uniref:Uncharacterized protein n=1 Tax=Diversispora epigaea TaxID=1348612 RepID=A0A397HSE5_9GLOM|nr:hypothetical protein Glove_309g83 [Diversispora epigaea]